MNMKDIRREKPYPLGVSFSGDRICFAVDGGAGQECVLKIYKKDSKKTAVNISMDKTYKTGNVFSCSIRNVFDDDTDYEYVFEIDGVECMDSRAKLVKGRNNYGKPSSNLRAVLTPDAQTDYGITDYTKPAVNNLVLYQLHVRGFSKHKSFSGSNKGTFLGICDKIPYLKELGVNGVLLLPAYEYNEIPKDTVPVGMPKDIPFDDVDDDDKNGRVNYWGYTTDAFYFAPKTSYASGNNAIDEFSCMVSKLHENGIAVLMDMHFPGKNHMNMIVDCLRHWVVNYNVDGFRINNDSVDEGVLRCDPVLADTYILGNYWYERNVVSDNVPKFADCNDSFMNRIRQFIKGDNNNILELVYEMMENGYGAGGISKVNYLADVNGFTLMDSLSYNMKHNEANGENNHDGTEFNYSMNCGFEGKTRRKYVLERRRKYIKNELMLLMMSYGIPMLLAGDEFGNSQEGNNNAYCQDNRISWLDWSQMAKNKELVDYVSRLIEIRNNNLLAEFESKHPIASGIPEISYHGVKPWATDGLSYNRTAGIMIASKGLYIAINMDGNKHEFELPKLYDECQWKLHISTSDNHNEGFVLPSETIAIYLC